jgi:hypothetical protein
MRTAELIFKEQLPNKLADEFKAFKKSEPDLFKIIISSINEARKEAIEECLNKFDSYELPTKQVQDDIRSLLNELK